MKIYTITDKDFENCIGSWLNADNDKYQRYVQGIKLFKEYLDDKYFPEAPTSPIPSEAQNG